MEEAEIKVNSHYTGYSSKLYSQKCQSATNESKQNSDRNLIGSTELSCKCQLNYMWFRYCFYQTGHMYPSVLPVLRLLSQTGGPTNASPGSAYATYISMHCAEDVDLNTMPKNKHSLS